MLQKKFILPASLGLCAFVAGYSLHKIHLHQTQIQIQKITHAPTAWPVSPDTPALTGSLRPAFKLRDLQNRNHSIQEWDGKIILLNFWATWCSPCRAEIPALVAIQTKYQTRNFQVIGIAIDDAREIKKFIATQPINYPILHGQQDAMQIGKIYGNRTGALPYTVLIDPSGTIRYTHDRGKLSETALEKILQPLIQSEKLQSAKLP